MRIRRAKRADLSAINALLQSYALAAMDSTYINHRDVCLVAEDDKRIVGIVWAGLMRQNKSAYVDYYTVSAAHAHSGLGHQLGREMLAKLLRMGVERVFGIIKRDKWHDQSAFNALKMGMFSDLEPYTHVYGFTQHSAKELGV